MDLGILGRVDDLVMRGVLAAVSNVVIDGVIEKHGILGNDTNGLMKAVLGDIAHILPVDANRTVGDVVKTEQQATDCRFSGSRRPDDRDGLTGRDVDTDAP